MKNTGTKLSNPFKSEMVLEVLEEYKILAELERTQKIELTR
jgi:hypothetical protein